jgi:hypothetical protein
MGEWRYSSTFLDLYSGLNWAVCFTPLPLYPRGKSHRIHWIGGSVGPRVSLDAADKKTLHYRESNPGHRTRSPSLYRVRSSGTSKVYNNNNKIIIFKHYNESIAEPLFSFRKIQRIRGSSLGKQCLGPFHVDGSMNDFLIHCREQNTWTFLNMSIKVSKHLFLLTFYDCNTFLTFMRTSDTDTCRQYLRKKYWGEYSNPRERSERKIEKFYREKFSNLYSSRNTVRVRESGRFLRTEQVASNGDIQILYKILADKPEGKRPFERLGKYWNIKIKMV